MSHPYSRRSDYRPTRVCLAICLALGFAPACSADKKGGDEPTSESAQKPSAENSEKPAPGDHGDHPQHEQWSKERGAKAHNGHGKHEHGPIGHRFERAEEWVERFDDPERGQWQKPDAVIALMAIEPGMTAVDIGAGTGYFLPYLARACTPSGRVLALDIEPDMVRYLKERAAREKLDNVEARAAKVADPELQDGSVDRVLVVNTWHHVPARTEYAGRLERALRAGGAVYIVDFTLTTERGPPKAHRLPPDKVADELRAAGLKVEVHTDVLPDQYVVVGRKSAG